MSYASSAASPDAKFLAVQDCAVRLASFIAAGQQRFGIVTDTGLVDLTERLDEPSLRAALGRGTDRLARLSAASSDWSPGDVTWLPPITDPVHVIGIGLNTRSHFEETAELMGRTPGDFPKYPRLFMRSPMSHVGHGEPIAVPAESDQLDYEGEIAIIIGRDCKHVPKEKALGLIAGFTLCNEGTIRDWTRHGQFNVTQGKNFDATGGIGPWIETDIDPSKPLHLIARKNGEVTQDDTTASMIFSFADIIAYTTSFMTLKAGDIICTGTPIKKGPKSDPPIWLKPGDTIEVECPSIGVLRNSVVAEA
jgi:2-keto-4-pentenoate hydratase/2-oxohepta-3-ene-1,7-dioic acid hydratase in catechol pathway